MNEPPSKKPLLNGPAFWPGERPEKPRCEKEFWQIDSLGPAALSAVYAWIMEHPDWLAVWVNGYKTMKWEKVSDCMVSIQVGGHYRRRPHMGKCPQNLALTCKFDRSWSRNTFLQAPFCAARERWTKDGMLIPRSERTLAWTH